MNIFFHKIYIHHIGNSVRLKSIRKYPVQMLLPKTNSHSCVSKKKNIPIIAHFGWYVSFVTCYVTTHLLRSFSAFRLVYLLSPTFYQIFFVVLLFSSNIVAKKESMYKRRYKCKHSYPEF